MWPFLCVVGGVVGLLVLFFFFGLWKLRRSIRQAAAGIVAVNVSDIPFLTEECIRVFKEKFGVDLNLDDMEATAWLLDEHLRTRAILNAFDRTDFRWYFVKPVGAFVGELLRRHSGSEWHKQEGRPPYLKRTTLGSVIVRTLPFEKVLKHCARAREKGDFYAYLNADEAMDPPTGVATDAS